MNPWPKRQRDRGARCCGPPVRIGSVPLETQDVMDVSSGIHGRLVVADRRVVQFHAEDAVIAVLLEDFVHTFEIDDAIAQGAKTGHGPLGILLAGGIDVFQVHIAEPVPVFVKGPDAVHAG